MSSTEKRREGWRNGDLKVGQKATGMEISPIDILKRQKMIISCAERTVAVSSVRQSSILYYILHQSRRFAPWFLILLSAHLMPWTTLPTKK